MLFSTYLQAIELTAETCVNSTNEAEKLFDEKKITQGEYNKILEPLCDKGCGRACTKLGGVLGTKAFKEKGCNAKLSHPWACYDLSFETKDKNKKLELKKKACELGFTLSCDFLAGDFAREKNYGLALKYYNIGCDLGGDQCCGNLGMIYARGDYGERNDKKAYEYWSKSVKLNPNNAQSKSNLKVLCKNNPVCK